MNIIVGSTSIHKINAVQQACQELGIKANIKNVYAPSGQNAQPVGFNETFSGAYARAKSAQSNQLGTIAIGIESGIFRISNRDKQITLDIAIIVVLTPGGRCIITTTESIRLPEEYVSIAEQRGFASTTVGSVLAEQCGGDSTDPHSIITKGEITRTMTLVGALKNAFTQIM